MGGKPDLFVDYIVVPNSPNLHTANFLTETKTEIPRYEKTGRRKTMYV